MKVLGRRMDNGGHSRNVRSPQLAPEDADGTLHDTRVLTPKQKSASIL